MLLMYKINDVLTVNEISTALYDEINHRLLFTNTTGNGALIMFRDISYDTGYRLISELYRDGKIDITHLKNCEITR